MQELRAIREQMSASHRGQLVEDSSARSTETTDAQALLQTYRAQVEQCETLKVELNLIHDAIARTKQEVAVLQGKTLNGVKMARASGELGAAVGGIETATQQILEAAEAIDQSAAALSSIRKPVTPLRTTSTRCSAERPRPASTAGVGYARGAQRTYTILPYRVPASLSMKRVTRTRPSNETISRSLSMPAGPGRPI
jgi:hypothetical protein